MNTLIATSNLLLVYISRSGLFTFFKWPFHFDYPEKKFHFIFPTVKSDVNRIFLRQNEISFGVSCKHSTRGLFLEIYFRVKLNIFNSVSSQSLATVYIT